MAGNVGVFIGDGNNDLILSTVRQWRDRFGTVVDVPAAGIVEPSISTPRQLLPPRQPMNVIVYSSAH